jgi:protein-disulfide isomerase
MKLNKIFLLITGLFLVSSVIHTETYLKNDTDTSTELLSKILKELESLKKGQEKLASDIKTLKKGATTPPQKAKPSAAQASVVKNIPIGDSIVLGNPNAPVTIIKWTDFQ